MFAQSLSRIWIRSTDAPVQSVPDSAHRVRMQPETRAPRKEGALERDSHGGEVGQLGLVEDRLSETGLGDVCVGEARANEPSPRRVHGGEIGRAEIAAGEIGADERGAAQGRPGKPRPDQGRPIEPHALQERPRKVAPGEVGSGQVGSREISPRQRNTVVGLIEDQIAEGAGHGGGERFLGRVGTGDACRIAAESLEARVLRRRHPLRQVGGQGGHVCPCLRQRLGGRSVWIARRT